MSMVHVDEEVEEDVVDVVEYVEVGDEVEMNVEVVVLGDKSEADWSFNGANKRQTSGRVEGGGGGGQGSSSNVGGKPSTVGVEARGEAPPPTLARDMLHHRGRRRLEPGLTLNDDSSGEDDGYPLHTPILNGAVASSSATPLDKNVRSTGWAA
jgi:hypothetical protein